MNQITETKKTSTTQSNRPGRWIAAVAIVAVVAVAAAWLGIPAKGAAGADIVVYKTPSCGCCNNWVTHLRDHGFEVNVVNVSNTQPARERLGVPRRLGSCHTAQVGEYWVEGHVPADLVERLLTEHSDDIRGIAVPGMPIGSPGMEGPNPVAYEVLAYDTDSNTTIYATRQGKRSP
jgi:hypothetical protein